MVSPEYPTYLFTLKNCPKHWDYSILLKQQTGQTIIFAHCFRMQF